jgi:hypothetical protein
MPLLGNADELESSPACLQGFADGIDAVDQVHLGSLNASQAGVLSPGQRQRVSAKLEFQWRGHGFSRGAH